MYANRMSVTYSRALKYHTNIFAQIPRSFALTGSGLWLCLHRMIMSHDDDLGCYIFIYSSVADNVWWSFWSNLLSTTIEFCVMKKGHLFMPFRPPRELNFVMRVICFPPDSNTVDVFLVALLCVCLVYKRREGSTQQSLDLIITFIGFRHGKFASSHVHD